MSSRLAKRTWFRSCCQGDWRKIPFTRVERSRSEVTATSAIHRVARRIATRGFRGKTKRKMRYRDKTDFGLPTRGGPIQYRWRNTISPIVPQWGEQTVQACAMDLMSTSMIRLSILTVFRRPRTKEYEPLVLSSPGALEKEPIGSPGLRGELRCRFIRGGTMPCSLRSSS